jgi:RNA polymerase-binding transcription factor DksA
MRASDAQRFLEAEHARLMDVKASLQHDRLSEESQRRSTAELSGSDEHLADVASETAEREVELSVLATVDAELGSVRAALLRVEAGTFGICVECGAAIGDDRLRAVPATDYCVVHQGTAERAQEVTEDHGCAREIEHEAFAHLDLLPQDDEDISLGAEESAMGVSRY